MRQNHVITRSGHIMHGASCLELPQCNAVVYIKNREDGKIHAMGFSGKKSKPDFNYLYRDQVRLQSHLKDWQTNLETHQQAKQQNMLDRRNFTSTLKCGDILCSSWGYDQTNVDFYQIVERTGRVGVIIRKISSTTFDSVTGIRLVDQVLPVKDSFISEPIRKKIGVRNYIRIASFSHATLWDGSAQYRTSYA